MNTATLPAADPAALARSTEPAPYARSALTRAGLTRQQQCVLDYVRIFAVMNDQLPPLATIATAFGYASPNAAHDHLKALERAGHLARNELGNLMIASPARNFSAPMQLRALQALAEDLIHPEQFGWAVTPEIRDRARQALGMRACETAAVQVASYGAPA